MDRTTKAFIHIYGYSFFQISVLLLTRAAFLLDLWLQVEALSGSGLSYGAGSMDVDLWASAAIADGDSAADVTLPASFPAFGTTVNTVYVRI